MPKNKETKRIGDLQYKCRRCGSVFITSNEEHPEYGFEVGLNLHCLQEIYWSRLEREAYYKNLCNMVRIPLDIPDIPESLTTHHCEDKQIGIADLVGIVNLRTVIMTGRFKKPVLEV